jgi:type I restriction enzyme M protein
MCYDDGVGYGDYLEQITYLLFLKMADRVKQATLFQNLVFPKIKDSDNKETEDGEVCNWPTLSGKEGRN